MSGAVRHGAREPHPSPLGGPAQHPSEGQQHERGQAGKGHGVMSTASWAGAVVERGLVPVDNERDEVGVVIIDRRCVMSIELPSAGGRQMLVGGGRMGGRVVERELVQDQHTQRDGSDT
jgi:hypothetical protein